MWTWALGVRIFLPGPSATAAPQHRRGSLKQCTFVSTTSKQQPFECSHLEGEHCAQAGVPEELLEPPVVRPQQVEHVQLRQEGQQVLQQCWWETVGSGRKGSRSCSSADGNRRLQEPPTARRRYQAPQLCGGSKADRTLQASWPLTRCPARAQMSQNSQLACSPRASASSVKSRSMK